MNYFIYFTSSVHSNIRRVHVYETQTHACKSEFVPSTRLLCWHLMIGFSTYMSLLRQGFRSYSFSVYWLIASNAL